MGDLPLRGAARLRGDRKEAVLGGSSRCAGLLNGRAGEEAASGGAHPGGAHPAARGCSIEGGRRLLLGELPLRGAARWRGEKAAFGGAPAARGCSIEGGRMLLLGELPLSGAARLRGEKAAFGGAPAARGCSMAGRGRRLLVGELPLRGAARLRGDRKEAVLGGSSRCAGLLNGRAGEEAAFGGAHPGGAHPAARGCSIEGGRRLLLGDLPLRGAARLRGDRKEAVLGGSSRCAGLLNGRAGEEAASGGAHPGGAHPAARGCSIEGGRRLLLGELPLRGAARWRGEKAAFGGAPAARGCSIEGGRMLLLGELPLSWAARLRGEKAAFGGAPAARGCSMAGRGRRLLLGELPLRGAARLRGDRKEAVLGGSSRCAGLLNGRAGEEAASGGAHPGGAHPAARGCSIEGGRRLLLGDLPLRGAARLRGDRKEAVLGGSSRCAGLLNGRAGEEAASGGAHPGGAHPAARGCSIEGGRRLLLGELPLRGAARWRGEKAAFGGAPAARGCSIEGGRMLLLGELPLSGAARLRGEKAAFGGAPAARGCSMAGRGRRLLLGELPLRGAARLRGDRKEAVLGGSSRCAGLLNGRAGEEAAFGGAAAERGCSIEGGSEGGCFGGELPLRGAAQWQGGGGGCFWGRSSRCAGLLD